MIEIGQLIRQKLKERKKTVVWFADQLACSRTNIYKIFERTSIDTADLLRICTILDYDFFAEYSKRLKENKKSGRAANSSRNG